MQKLTAGERVFTVLNYVFLSLLSFSCIAPILHLLALSFSSKGPAMAGEVVFWPVDFTLLPYEFIIKKPDFLQALVITLKRLVLGIPVNMFLIVLCAYPLSQEHKAFRFRTAYVWYFVITMLFSGGLIPLYMTVKATGMIDNILALIIPGAVPVFSVILVVNFFRGLPRELQESAFMDGAGHWKILWKIYVPTSLPVMATVGLFTAVSHWNSWFDGLIFMNSPKNYPLQSYLQTILINVTMIIGSAGNKDAWRLLAAVSDQTAKAAQIFLGALPILLVYPFLQKYFIKGIVLGSVKG